MLLDRGAVSVSAPLWFDATSVCADVIVRNELSTVSKVFSRGSGASFPSGLLRALLGSRID